MEDHFGRSSMVYLHKSVVILRLFMVYLHRSNLRWLHAFVAIILMGEFGASIQFQINKPNIFRNWALLDISGTNITFFLNTAPHDWCKLHQNVNAFTKKCACEAFWFKTTQPEDLNFASVEFHWKVLVQFETIKERKKQSLCFKDGRCNDK